MDNLFIERNIYQEIKKWLEEPEIIAISGPRQSGKTTLLRKIAEELGPKNTQLVNFEELTILEDFLASPKTFIKTYLRNSLKTYFLFDEYQYVENGGQILKLLYDTYPQAKFIITGSSSLKIKQLASFLVGRSVFFNLYPLSFAEFISFEDPSLYSLYQNINQYFKNFMNQPKRGHPLPNLIFQEKFNQLLNQYLQYGGYPAVAISKNKEKRKKRLEGLIDTYVEKDIIKNLQVGNYLEFKNLTKILAAQTGNILNYSSLGADSRLSFRELKKFIGILEQTMVINLIPPFFKNLITELKKNPKIYFVDTGLRNCLIDDFREPTLRPDKGELVENFVFRHLSEINQSISFWRTKTGAEVDFCLSKEGQIIPIEVKFQKMNKPQLTRSFLSFLKTYSPTKGLVITKDFLAQTEYQRTAILFLPCYLI